MASLGKSFKASEHDTDSQRGDYAELPNGIYELEIESSEVKENSNQNGTLLKYSAVVLRPEDYAGRKMFGNINLEHANPKAQEIGQQEFAKLCRAIGEDDVDDSETLHFKAFTVKIALGKPSKEKEADGTPKYPARAEIKKYFYPDQGDVPEPGIDEAQPAAAPSKPVAANSNRPTAKPANDNAPAAAGKARPWGKK